MTQNMTCCAAMDPGLRRDDGPCEPLWMDDEPAVRLQKSFNIREKSEFFTQKLMLSIMNLPQKEFLNVMQKHLLIL
jgi:hypothetical protein